MEKTKESKLSPGTVNATDKPKSHSIKSDQELLTKNPGDKQMLEQVPINETPFTAIRFDEKWFLAIGKYRLTEPMQSLEEVKEHAKDASWWRIMQLCNIMIAESETLKKLESKIIAIEQLLKSHPENLNK